LTYAYDTGNNLTNLSHQANSNTWQQTLTIHPNNNRGTEIQQSTSDFDANGNLLTLNNIGTLHWWVLSLLLSLRIWVPMCRVLVCCFAWLVEVSNKGR
jgi:hypothetical protein